MSLNIFDKAKDSVLDGIVATGNFDYTYAIENLIPLINKTDFQRKLQNGSFYDKLKRDIENGCIMPPITIAFVTKDISCNTSTDNIQTYIENNISKSFILDGIQRLNTLSKLKKSNKLNFNQPLYVNYIFCNSVDKLLYRMITLNNGQKPMTPRHQVEAIMSNMYCFDTYDFIIDTEKDTKNKSFRKSDFIQAYLAFMADSPIIDNKKIIQEKMDELLVGKIISAKPNEFNSQFSDILQAISKFHENNENYKWLKQTNNLVGFSVGMKKSADIILETTIDEFTTSIKNFEEAFSNFNVSKIKVGKYRRELACEYFRNYDKYKYSDTNTILEFFSNLTNDN